MGEIINKIEKSGLVNLDLADFYPKGKRLELDISQFLWQGIILKEKEFRDAIKNHNWNHYQDSFVAVFCSEEAIIANWAYMLIATNLKNVAKRVVFGSVETLENILFDESISTVNINDYQDKRVLIKGCGSTPIPTSAFMKIVTTLQPVVKSLMYGEACSSVPVFKRK